MASPTHPSATLPAGHPSFFKLLTPEQQAHLRQAGKLKRYADGAILHRCGDVEQSMGVVESGAIVLANLAGDGRKIVTAQLLPGDSYGEFTLFANAPRYHDAEAKGATTVLHLGPQAFRRCMDESPALRDAVLTMLAHRLQWALDRIDDRFELPLGKRLVKQLLQAARADASGLRYQRSQTELAEALGVSRVALGLALRPLVQQRWLATEYRAIVLLQPQALQRWLAD